jgi:lipopolysaccharide transport protein LptA
VASPLLIGLALAQTGTAAEETKCAENISLDAASSQVDYKTSVVEFRDVVISQCDTRVQAQHAKATGLDFDDTRWTFDGNVRMSVEQRGSLHSDHAVVDFRNNQISKATITGTPAEFEQRRTDSDAMARGRAGEIVYEVGAGTVKLSGDAWLSDGRTEIKSDSFVYDIRKERVQAATQPGAGERVRVTITPKGATQNGGDATQTPPQDDTPQSDTPQDDTPQGETPQGDTPQSDAGPQGSGTQPVPTPERNPGEDAGSGQNPDQNADPGAGGNPGTGPKAP